MRNNITPKSELFPKTAKFDYGTALKKKLCAQCTEVRFRRYFFFALFTANFLGE
jgi:hypothetical protein